MLRYSVVLAAACSTSSPRSIPLRTPVIAHAPTGFPTPSRLHEILNEPYADVTRCAELLADRDTVHRAELLFAIQPDGSVSDVAVDRPSGAVALDSCLIELVRAKRFPYPDASTPLDVRVAFDPRVGETMLTIRTYAWCR
jgi:TonB family protein